MNEYTLKQFGAANANMVNVLKSTNVKTRKQKNADIANEIRKHVIGTATTLYTLTGAIALLCSPFSALKLYSLFG